MFHYFFPCETNSHTVIFISGDVADGGALDRQHIRNPCVNRVDVRTIDPSSSTCLNASVRTVQIHCAETHRDRRIMIQRASFDAFYNAHREDRSGASIRDLTATKFG